MNESIENVETGNKIVKRPDSLTELIKSIYNNYEKALGADGLICERLGKKGDLYVNPKKLDRVNPEQIVKVLKFLDNNTFFNQDELKQLCTLVVYYLLINSSGTINSFFEPKSLEIGKKMLDVVEVRVDSEFVKKAVKRVRLEKCYI